jgi:hypothetical protein
MMQKNSKRFPPYGIGTWSFPDNSNAEYLAKTKRGAFFPVTRGGPFRQMTFRPEGWDYDCDTYGAKFDRILKEQLGIRTRRIDKVSYDTMGNITAYLSDD